MKLQNGVELETEFQKNQSEAFEALRQLNFPGFPECGGKTGTPVLDMKEVLGPSLLAESNDIGGLQFDPISAFQQNLEVLKYFDSLKEIMGDFYLAYTSGCDDVTFWGIGKYENLIHTDLNRLTWLISKDDKSKILDHLRENPGINLIWQSKYNELEWKILYKYQYLRIVSEGAARIPANGLPRHLSFTHNSEIQTIELGNIAGQGNFNRIYHILPHPKFPKHVIRWPAAQYSEDVKRMSRSAQKLSQACKEKLETFCKAISVPTFQGWFSSDNLAHARYGEIHPKIDWVLSSGNSSFRIFDEDKSLNSADIETKFIKLITDILPLIRAMRQKYEWNHFDIKPDNIAFRDGMFVLIDTDGIANCTSKPGTFQISDRDYRPNVHSGYPNQCTNDLMAFGITLVEMLFPGFVEGKSVSLKLLDDMNELTVLRIIERRLGIKSEKITTALEKKQILKYLPSIVKLMANSSVIQLEGENDLLEIVLDEK